MADKKWDEAEFKQAFGHLKGLLENESARKAGIFINPNEVYSRFLRDAKEDFSQSFMDFNAEGSRAMYEAVAANIDKLMEVDSFRRRQMIMLDDEFASVDKSEKEKILSLLENNYASVFRLSSFYSNEGSVLLRDMRGATYAGDGNFQAAIEEVKDKPVNYDASVTIYGRTIAESKFIDVQRRYLDSISWNQIVKDVHEHYNFDGKRARQKLEEIARSKSEQPIVLPAFGDKPELKLMDSSPANEMRKQLKNDGFDSWFDWLTDWRKRVEESKSALGDQPTE